MDMRRLVGLNVRKLRQDKGLTQEEFAVRSGFSQQYISDLERGRRNPTIVSLFELAQALGAKPVDLLRPETEAEDTAE
jgi:transcriptional regulator with XRE-family HTH domain